MVNGSMTGGSLLCQAAHAQDRDIDARAALRRVEEEVLRDHITHCVEHAIVSGDAAEQRRKIAELMDVLSRTAR